MKIERVTDEAIHFSNGKKLKFWHARACCEHNYADFYQLDCLALNAEFEEVGNCGFSSHLLLTIKTIELCITN